jgi:CRISPR system Cascade subunit CasE
MYFCVIEPEEGREREAAFARLDGPYAEHQWLWRFFPAESGARRDFLFRSTEFDRGRRYYVVAEREPKSLDSPWRVRVKHYAPQLHEGQRLKFELRANPVVTTRRDGKARRDDVVMARKKRLLVERGISRWGDWKTADRPPEQELAAEACTQWLCGSGDDGSSRAGRGGFRVVDHSLGVDCYQQHRSRNHIRFSTVDLSGLLVVEDPATFERTLREGIGHGRAFGCGLVLVKPV